MFQLLRDNFLKIERKLSSGMRENYVHNVYRKSEIILGIFRETVKVRKIFYKME